MKKQSQRKWLLALFGISMVVTLVHYVDNIINLKTYPDPPILTAPDLEVVWVIMAAFGVTGYMLFLRGKFTESFYSFYAYCFINLLVLLHYLFMNGANMTFKINFLIIAEAVTGAILALYVARLHRLATKR